jgi:hypothetical protein
VSDDIRPDVLDRVRAEYVDLAARMHADVMRLIDDLELTRAERLRIAVELADSALGELHDVGALHEPRGLLDMTKNEIDLARQLRRVGIHELDELSPPDLMTNDADDG